MGRKTPMTPAEVVAMAQANPSFREVKNADGTRAGWTHETYDGYVFGYYADGTGVNHCLRAFASSLDSMRDTLRAGKPDTCGIPNKANYYVHAVIGRDLNGNPRTTETSYTDIYVCGDHLPAGMLDYVNKGDMTDQDYPGTWHEVSKPVRGLFRFDQADEWDVLEFRVTHLR